MSANITLLCICISGIALPVIALHILRSKKKKLWILCLICLLGILIASVNSFFYFQVRVPKMQIYADMECNIEGTVIKRTSTQPYASAFLVKLDSINGEACKENVKLECQYASGLQPGDRFSMHVTGRAFVEEEGYDERASSLADEIMAVFVCESSSDCNIYEEKGRNLRVCFADWNAELSYRLQRDVGGREGKLAAALLLGNRDVLDGDTVLAFSRAGVSHLLALSGLHISILIGFADLLLRICKCPKQGRMIAIVLLAVFYLFLTGCSPSTARAVCMFLIVAGSFYAKTQNDSFTGLSIALSVLMLLFPASVFDLGMWMSFIAAGSIIIFLPAWQSVLRRIYESKRLPNIVFRIFAGVTTALFAGVLANMAMVYIQAVAFLNLPILSVPHTMILSIPMSLTLYLSLITLCFPLAAVPCRWIIGLILFLTEQASDLSNILIPMNHPVPYVFAGLLTLSLIFLALAKLKRPYWVLLPVVFLCLTVAGGIFFSANPTGEIRVDYLQKGGGDLLLFSDGGEALAVDFSDGSAGAAHDLAKTAKEARCMEINNLVISHYHNKGAYFIHSIATEIKVRNLRLPLPQNEWEEGVAKRMQEEADAHGVAVFFDLEGIEFSTLQIDLCTRAPSDTDGHEALLLAVRANESAMVYLNASVPKSSLYWDAAKLMNQCEFLLVGDTGYSKADPVRLPYLSYSPKQIFLADEKLRDLFPRLPYEVPVTSACEHTVFYLS